MLVPLGIFLITRVGLFLVGGLGNTLLPSAPPQIYSPIRPDSFWLGLFSKYDSEWYVLIAARGYSFSAETFSPAAFFPLYPILMRVLAFFVGKNLYLAGLLISNGSLLVGLIFLYRLVWDVYGDEAMAQRAVLYLSLFPSGVFFSAIYTESLFFLTVVGCVYFARQRRWWVSALFGAVASATRSLGVLVLLWAGWEWLKALGWNWRKPFALPGWAALRREWGGLTLTLIPVGLVAFMLYLWWAFGDPLAFLNAQSGWKQHLVGPIQVLVQYFSRLASEPSYEYAPVFNYSLILVVIFCAAMPLIGRRLGGGAVLFCSLCVLIPFSASLLSLHRFILPLFPLSMVLAEWGKRRWVNWAILVIFPLLLSVFTVAFTNWRLFF